MKLVSGGDIGDLPLSIEKRLVLDDEEMDPALTSRSENNSGTIKQTEEIKPVVEEKAKKMETSEPIDILDDALDEVFEDNVSEYEFEKFGDV